jgi:hypothetical protein
MMDDNKVSGLMTLFLYGIDKAPDLGPSIVDLMADDLVNQIHYRQPVQDYFDAFGVVLSRGQVPPHALEGIRRYSPAEVLDFIGRLHAKLDEQRPWPRPRFTKLDLAEWPSFATAKGIARIAALSSEVEARFNTGFDKVPTGAGDLPVMILELRSGEKVAILGSTERGSRVYTLLARDPNDPATTIGHFRELSGFPEDQVAPLT